MITGLDPAEPYFQGYGPAVILDPTDAIFVEVSELSQGYLNSWQIKILNFKKFRKNFLNPILGKPGCHSCPYVRPSIHPSIRFFVYPSVYPFFRPFFPPCISSKCSIRKEKS